MATGQIRVEERVKREVEVFAAASGQQQKDLVSRAWDEYRERHADELRSKLRWAHEALDRPAEAAVLASGMPEDELDELATAFGE